MSIGENVKRIMAEKKIKQNELARMIGMSSSGISTALAQDANPRESTIRAIAQALGCSIGELFGDNSSTGDQERDPQEKKLLEFFRQLTPISKITAVNIIEQLLKNQEMRQEGTMSSMG